MTDILQEVQELQFTDKTAAENRLLSFIQEALEFDAVKVELRPLAVSLNSFNGFVTLADSRRLFFKTHTEHDTVIAEYYNAGAMADAGYDVVRPVHTSVDVGRQLLMYEVIEDPTAFDVAWAIETGDDAKLPALREAQEAADRRLLELHRATLDWQTADKNELAPVHQLFHHRLARGRLDRFYSPDKTIALPERTFSLAEVRAARWMVNGSKYEQTIDDLVAEALDVLNPRQDGPTVVGHGDAHNGNVFFDEPARRLYYFDPAFAGRHHPLLDLVKPLFHNVFAMWMYFPRDKDEQTSISMARDGSHIEVEHDYALPPVRELFLRSKVESTLIPIVGDLAERGWLREDWRRFLKLALFCCPLLTMNLADPQKFPPNISLLGLTMAVQMGAESNGARSLIDQTLDEVAAAL